MTLYCAHFGSPVPVEANPMYTESTFLVEGTDVDDACEQIAYRMNNARFMRVVHEAIEDVGEDRGDVLVLYRQEDTTIQDVIMYIKDGVHALLRHKIKAPTYLTIHISEVDVSRGSPIRL